MGENNCLPRGVHSLPTSVREGLSLKQHGRTPLIPPKVKRSQSSHVHVDITCTIYIPISHRNFLISANHAVYLISLRFGKWLSFNLRHSNEINSRKAVFIKTLMATITPLLGVRQKLSYSYIEPTCILHASVIHNSLLIKHILPHSGSAISSDIPGQRRDYIHRQLYWDKHTAILSRASSISLVMSWIYCCQATGCGMLRWRWEKLRFSFV